MVQPIYRGVQEWRYEYTYLVEEKLNPQHNLQHNLIVQIQSAKNFVFLATTEFFKERFLKSLPGSVNTLNELIDNLNKFRFRLVLF